ncbi:SusC/RagA family TonB-linked outer membrane protein [Pedobacter hiemivivus]|uniref:SusC/RagA family TonB-linked outer membrane protein n=2 Tax=Pedobacter hiemivivus TaxID=2530454 RepID=A0A4U1GKY5_9SPHI|nr:SusC/RagA family TonB-linked outer membrane protein [Pedobacter hiemivivus]
MNDYSHSITSVIAHFFSVLKRKRTVIGIKKLILMMKLTAIIILALTFQATASSFAQKVTISKNDASLKELFKEIRRQTGYYFIYNNEVIERAGTVNVQVKNKDVSDVLKDVFSLKRLSFSIEETNIIVKVKDAAPDRLINGKIVADEDGQPLPGVSIKVKGSTKSTSTNTNGEFSIRVSDGEVLVVTMIGYLTQEVPTNGKTTLNIKLKQDNKALSEVVVTGFQNINKKLFTGSAVTISGADVKQDGAVDISRMLEGKVAGVSVQNVSGTFGTAPKIRVRGATSISGENKPLWVIDGVVLEDVVNISNDQLSSGDATTLLGSSVAGINADDIESFNILKDASATALYGARAMNGVVVITTKKGKAGNTAVNYSGNFSSFLKPNYSTFNIMNSADEMSVYAEIYRKGGLGPNIVNGEKGGVFAKMYQQINAFDASTGKFGVVNTAEGRASFLKKYATANTDWFDLLFKNSFVQEHSLSISSGSEKSQHYFSVGYYDDNGWTLADEAKRYTMNLRGNYNLSPKLSVGILGTGALRIQKAPGTLGRTSNVVEGKYTREFDINPFSYALNTSRTMRAYDENGNLEYFINNYAPFNIIEELDNNYIDLDMMDLKLQGELNYKFIKNFEFKSVGAMRYVKSTREHKITEYSNMANAYRYMPNSSIANANRFLYDDPDHPEVIDKVSVLPQGGFYNRNDDNLMSYDIRNQLDWKQKFGKHDVGAFIGQQTKFADRQNSYNNGYGYQYDKGGTPFTDYRIIKMLLESNYNYYGRNKFYDRYAAFFLNANYAYDSKYIFNGTVRYDGGNRMGASATARWLPTWTLSGAWNIDQEDFIKKVDPISYLKLRGGYGLTASLGDATNSSVVLLNSTTRRPRLSEVETRIVIDGLENSELTWEKQYETNVGVDFGLLQSRLNFSFDYYKRNGFDLIGDVVTSGIGGESTKTANYADMKSHGIEITLGGSPIKTSTFSWTTNFTFGYNKNKITNLKSKPRIYDLIVSEGGPAEGGAVRGLYSIDFQKLDGSGVPTFIDEEGNLSNNVYVQSTNTKYLKYEGPVDPPYTGGFNNTFRYKDFTFNFFVSYQAGNKIRLNRVFESRYGDNDALPREFLDRWTLPLDENYTNTPSIADYLLKKELTTLGAYPYSAYNYSSDRVADGSFVRLKQVSVAYNLSKKYSNALGVKNASLKLQGNNVWLVYADKKLKGQDPEFFGSGGVALPIPRQITLSLKVGF